ncbi:uncharacterized protein LOC141631100 [Silene latifolia]|uniref:uncharacterized protein LOC141631100 n=1 Tax=Silene latifolia TaxID=37657 RepID=UPI003D77B523
MEYLLRVLSYVTEIMNFMYHHLCGKMQLTDLMFADDLLMFGRGDPNSIMILLRSFATFSAASGLPMNGQKSNAYFNGVASDVKADILKVFGFIEGKLPFKYLGISITAGKIKKKDCHVLMDTVVERIRGFGAKKLSYMGRLVLVNALLTSIYSYWANIIIIPKGVLVRITAICRNYLLDGTSEYLRVPLVGWENLCSPDIHFCIRINYLLAGV